MMRIVLALTLLMSVLSAEGGCSPAPPPKPQVIPCDGSAKKYSEANIRSCTALLRSATLSDYDRAVFLNVRGNNYDASKQYDLAIADYSAVIRLRPDFEYGYANRALEECKKGDCKAALADYDTALKLDPDGSYARYGRGVTRLRLGDKAGGMADILQAKSSDPDVEGLYREIGFEPPR